MSILFFLDWLWLIEHFRGLNVGGRNKTLWHRIQMGHIQPPHPEIRNMIRFVLALIVDCEPSPCPPISLVLLYKPEILSLLQRNGMLSSDAAEIGCIHNASPSLNP